MKKILFAVVALAVVACVHIGVTLDDKIERHIEETASILAGVPVTIDELTLSILNGTGEIQGFKVVNPKGFSKSNAFEVDTVRFDVDFLSTFSQPLVVNSLVFLSPRINLEILEDYQSNLQKIVDVSSRQNRSGKKKKRKNRKRSSGSGGIKQENGSVDQSKGESDTEDDEDHKEDDDYFRTVVTDLLIQEIELNATRGNDKWTDTIPEIRMTNVGRNKGVGTRELGIILITRITNKTFEQAALRKLNDVVEEAAGDLGKKLLEALFSD